MKEASYFVPAPLLTEWCKLQLAAGFSRPGQNLAD